MKVNPAWKDFKAFKDRKAYRVHKENQGHRDHLVVAAERPVTNG